MLTDADIMLRVQAGECQLFAILVDRYRARLLRFASSKLGDHTAAEDVVQETLLAAYAARDSFRPEFAFSTWLWTILINLSRRSFRRKSRRRTHEAAFATAMALTGDSSPCGLSLLLRQERQDRVHVWLANIPEPEADAIRLRYFGQLPYEEIAAAMDSSLSGAKARVHRGLVRLAELAREER